MEDREDVYSKAVRAGKRTYFFDVRSTRGGDLFLNITESKKHTHEDGGFHFEKHKIYLYKEDFEKFLHGLEDTLAEIERLRSGGEPVHDNGRQGPRAAGDDPYTGLNFEDLDRKDI